MHRFSASISSLRGGNSSNSADKKGISEFGNSNSNNDGLPPIPQHPRQQQVQGQGHQRRQSQTDQIRQASSTSNAARRRSVVPAEMQPRPQSIIDENRNPTQVRSPTAGLHSLPACAQLLNARKVYMAGYLWRLDGHASSSAHTSHAHTAGPASPSMATSTDRQQPRFVKYYIRLEDCILCLWPDEELKAAQAKGTVVHPTSMNLQDGFVALADAKRAWASRAEEFNAPSPFTFVLNTAGNNSITFATESEVELRRWINTIRLAIWERQRLETLYTAARLGIKEEQQLNPIKSAISFSSSVKGAKVGRAEALLDVRLPGDTEWKRVYAVLTEPGNYKAANPRTSASNSASTSSNALPTSASSSSLASTTAKKKEKRKSFMSSLLGGGSSSNKDTTNEFGVASGSGTAISSSNANVSPVIASYNTQLEDPNVGPTLALFGILSSPAAPNSPNLRSSVDSKAQSANGLSSSTGPSISSLHSGNLQLTRRPLCVINQVWSAYAVWPENEALIPHARTFKVHGRMTWLEQEVLSYSQGASSASHAGHFNGPGTMHHDGTPKNPIHAFEETMKRENRDLGKADNQVQLLCMLVGNDADASASGPGHAVRSQFKNDTGGELLSWILGFYDAFRLHGRPDRMLYDPRNSLSPYFAQPAGPSRGGLYFDPPLIEDLPQFQDTHPRIINDGFMRILVDRMMKAYGRGGPNPGLPPQQQISARDVEQYRKEGPQVRGGSSTPSTPPILPPIGESQNINMGVGNSGRSTPTNQPRNTDSMGGPQRPLDNVQRPLDNNRADNGSPRPTYAYEERASPSISGGRGPPYAQDGRSAHGSPQPSYGQASSQRTGDQSSINSSPQRQAGAGMLRPGSASSSDAQRQSPYLSADRGDASTRQGAVSRGSSAVTNDNHQEYLQNEEGDGEGADLSYYNSRKVRSGHQNTDGRTPSREATPAVSSRAPSALSSTAAVPQMPGGYIPTPDLNRQEEVGPHNAFAPAQSLDARAPPRNHHPEASEQTLRGQQQQMSPSVQSQQQYTPQSEGVQAGTSRPVADMGSSSSPSLPPGQAEHEGDRVRHQDSDNHDAAALFDEPGAMYAMSLADDPHSMSRGASSTASQPSLSKLIMNRAAVANNGTPPPPHSDRSDSLANTVAGTLASASTTRQNTYAGSAPVSAAPTSASEYSQSGTMAESRSAPSRSGSQHLHNLPPSNLSKQVSRTPSQSASHTAAPPSGNQAIQDARQSKASTTSTAPSEGQDDYLAALNYVALAETRDQSTARSPPRPNGNAKPTIHINTNGQDNGATPRHPHGSTDPEPTSASSPMYDEPTSPDPYGSYHEPAIVTAPQMRVTNASPEKKLSNTRPSSSDKPRQASMTSHASSRKPGRGVPRPTKSGKKLGTWSSDEDDDDDSDKDSIDEEEEAERKRVEDEQRKAAEAAAIAEAERIKQSRQREERPNHLRESTTSSAGGGSLRRSLPGLPGPSTDPYLNRNASPTSGMYSGQDDRSPYSQDMQQQQYAQYAEANRGSMYGWPGQMQMQMPMGGGQMMSPPWQAQHQHRMSGGSPSQLNIHSPYSQTPSPSAYHTPMQANVNQNTMLAYMPDNPETAAADGKAMRNAAVAQHGLLQTGIEQKQNKSAAQMEAMAKETGGPLLQLDHKAQMPQGGLVGAIASHERDRKRDGGLGATLTERDRERRMAEMRQRETDQIGQRQQFGGPSFGIPGMPGMPAFGMPPGGYGGMGNADPAQMQQQIAMLAAQNAYLQAMAGFNQGGLMGNQGQPYMSPPFSPHMGGYGGPGSQAPFAGSYMGMGPPSQSPNQLHPSQDTYRGASPTVPGGDPRHGRQGSRSQSDFFPPR